MADIRAAKAICERCPVVAVCLEYALSTGQLYGVWGAKSAGQRRQLRPMRARPARPGRRPATPDRRCGTTAGYAAHRNRGEEACLDCKAANAAKSALICAKAREARAAA